MREKNQRVGRYWGHDHPLFNGYRIDPQALAPFSGNHPMVVRDWLAAEAETAFSPDLAYVPTAREIRHRRMMKLERMFGLEMSKKHYRLVKS
jgi:hypothetical protein